MLNEPYHIGRHSMLLIVACMRHRRLTPGSAVPSRWNNEAPTPRWVDVSDDARADYESGIAAACEVGWAELVRTRPYA